MNAMGGASGQRRWLRLAAVVLAAAALALGLAASARGHEGGIELTVSQGNLAAGKQVTVSGEGFSPNASIALRLTGAGGDAELGTASTDAEGDFSQQVTIPGDMVPGIYLIRTEGDEEASAELTVGAMPGMAVDTTAPAAERDRSAAAKAALVAAMVAVAALGAWLVAPRRRADSESHAV